VVKQYEQVKEKDRKSNTYAAQEALFNLDEEMSTKTMHAKNDKKAAEAEKAEVEVEEVSSDEEEEEDGGNWTEVRSGRRKGHTPTSSVEVQSDEEESDGELSGDEDASDDNSSTASAAGRSNDQAGKAG
jgi:hypothetical protein